MNTILVPTDFSTYALNALKVAASIARRVNAEIILVHNYSLPTEEFYNSYIFEHPHKEMKNMINKKFDDLLGMDFLQGISVKKQILTNMNMSEIALDKRYSDVDLIVMGSHGKSGFNKFFIGSNTEKVIKLANSPVLTIKNEIEDFNIKKMVFASNFFGESHSAFKKIKFIADLYGAEIVLLKVITPKHFEPTFVSRKLMQDFVDKFQLSNYTINIYNAHGIMQGIANFSDEVNADLIAIQTHGRSGLAHLINGNLAKDMAKHEDRPVLSIKIKDTPANISGLGWYLDHIEKTGAKRKEGS